MKRIAFAIILCVALRAAGAEPPAPLRIGRITIEATPVFNAAESGGGFYRAVNLLHVQTRPELLRWLSIVGEKEPRMKAVLLKDLQSTLRRRPAMSWPGRIASVTLSG